GEVPVAHPTGPTPIVPSSLATTSGRCTAGSTAPWPCSSAPTTSDVVVRHRLEPRVRHGLSGRGRRRRPAIACARDERSLLTEPPGHRAARPPLLRSRRIVRGVSDRRNITGIDGRFELDRKST